MRSFFLASMGMIHILASFPFAFAIYTYVFQIKSFWTLGTMSLFVILAIGADDVFVFIDAFNQHSHLPLTERFYKGWLRSTKAMGITSATTIGAFLVTAINPLNDISSFGVFTALLVLANFLYVISYFAAVVMFHHMYVKFCICACHSEDKEGSVSSWHAVTPGCCSIMHQKSRECGCCLFSCCLC